MDNNRELEKAMGKNAHREFSLMKPGDVPDTWANFVKCFKIYYK